MACPLHNSTRKMRCPCFELWKKELFQIKDGDILHNFNQINVLRISLWIGQALIAGSLKFTVTLPLSLVISENLSISILYICERNAGKLVYIYLVFLWEKRGKTASNPVTKLSYWCTVRHVCAASGRGCVQYKVYLNLFRFGFRFVKKDVIKFTVIIW